MAGASLNPNSSQIDIWVVRRAIAANANCIAERFLSVDEQKRANSFYQEKHQALYSLGRGLLRAVLGWYVEEAPEKLRFEYGAAGKPALSGLSSRLEFNVSHSEDWIAYAVSRDSAVGVDIEKVRELADWENVAREFYSEKEYEELRGRRVEERTEAFFKAWSRKEAYAKARGGGLSLPLAEIQMIQPPEERGRVQMAGGEASAKEEWTLLDLPLENGCVGAVVSRIAMPELRLRSFSEANACLAYLATNRPSH